jgi:transcriptional regulator of acetoin/glycerol metabolism
LIPKSIVLPPIRSRREDVLPYVLRIVGRPLVDLGPELVAALLTHLWPYNVRELSKVAQALRERGAGRPKLSLALIESDLAFIGGAADQTLPATSIRIDE